MARTTSRQRFTDYRDGVKSKGDRTSHGRARNSSKQRSRTFFELFRSFLILLRGYRKSMLIAITTLTIATLIKLAPPVSLKLAIDYVLVDRPLPAEWIERYHLPTDRVQLLLLIGGAVIITSLLASIVHLWGRWHATKTVNHVQVKLRKQAFEHGMHLPLHRVYELKSGGAASLLREDAGGAAELIFSLIYNPWRAVVQFVGSLIILAFVDWRMMTGGLLALPIVYFTHRTWIRRIRPLWRDVRSQRQEIDSYATEAFGGMRIVRAFARERTEAGRFVLGNDLLVRKQLFAWLWTRTIDFVWDTIIPLSSTLLLTYGGYRILQGTLTLGDLTMFLMFLAMLLEPLATLVSSAATFQNNLAGFERILDLLEEPTEMQASPAAVNLDAIRVSGALTFRDVCFRYPNTERLVLEGVSLEVRAGETIALVGRSGAGKTTFCNLVARFYDPTSGQILLDDRDLRDIHIGSYRRLFGIVEQDIFLFDGTIADNIAYGRRGASQAEVELAAQAANAHEFIAQLENGYATIIGERGVKLSGGQRQRLAIARALLADPKILILDEATSHLDSESERLIQTSLELLMRERTCFMIAHRMSTVALADRIVVLADGRIVEVGTHEELIAADGDFRRMVEMQLDVGATK
ncbi:MAG: ABC transporter ATP-binding protein [Planctomycetaceae bacterium]|nr:ABC transporter ATP-binding protein [Planctomycetales bacterium]MCB9922455.1 ABC transporter ATP-binding protein [Planctomycetaceae bacterium]